MTSTLESHLAPRPRPSVDDDTSRQGAVDVVSDANVVEDGKMSATHDATLSPESRRRSNIFGILHSETTTTATATATTTTTTTTNDEHVEPASPSHVLASPRPARMSVDSLVHRDGEQNGERFLAVLRDGAVHHGSSVPATNQPNGNHQAENGRRSLSPIKGERDSEQSRRSEGMMVDGFEEDEEPTRVSRRASLQAEIQEDDQNNHQANGHEHGGGDDGREQEEGEHGNPQSSGEEDEGEIDGAIDGDQAEAGDDDEEEDDEESSDDDDEEGSIDLEEDQEDVGDSPVFISMRNGPLGIPDLLSTPAAGDVVRVKTEPEDPQSQGGSSDVVLLGSQPPSPFGATDASGPMEVVPTEVASSRVEGAAEGVPEEAAADPVNVLVARPKKKKARPKSPSPPPPPPPKMRTTIRVVFNLFDEEEGPDGKVVKPEPVKEEIKAESAVDGQGDVPMDSNDSKEEPVPVEKPVPKPGEEPKFRVVNFKEASIAQGKVDTDYYVVNSGWNATESEDDDGEEDDDMDGEGADAGRKVNKKKFRELLTTNATAGTSAAGAQEPPAAAPGILEAMMGGADAAELERLAAELDKKYNAKPLPVCQKGVN